MKKYILYTLLFLLCVGAVTATYFLKDHSSPIITVKGTPTLGCAVSFDDLMNYASADDDKEVKSFFIEEKNLSNIADYKYLTYVAIDESNNVTKQRVSVNVDSDLTTYHIEVLKPLQAQIKEKFKTNEYLALKNNCGWEINDQFVIEGVDYTQADTYDAKVLAKKHSYVDPVYTTVEVADFKAPRIFLNEETYKDWTNMYYSDEYFLEFIDHVEDDNDNPEELKSKITSNWKEVLMASSSGYVDRTGTFTITYRVTDSDGNTGKTTLRFILDRVVYATEGE